MKKSSKLILCAAVAVAITMGGTMTGCVTMNEEDVKQTVATVNISESDAFAEQFKDYASAVTTETILKRDLIAAFLNNGSSLIQQGASYEAAFNTINEGLVQNAVVTQYATAALLKNKVEKGELSLSDFKSKDSEKGKYEYLLGGEDSLGVKRAKYNLNSSLNTLLDSNEKSYIKKTDSSEYEGSGARSTPANVDKLNEDFVPENYNVYTGYEGYLLSGAGDEYEPLDGTNRNTRRKAYAAFVKYLETNYLLTAEDKDNTDILSLSYVQDMYIAYLQQEVISEFNEMFEKAQEDLINSVEGGVYTYVKSRYESIRDDQKKTYTESTSFESALSSLSDSTFILYSPDTTKDTVEQDGTYGTYGYVYNILLPFSTKQSADLTTYQGYRDKDANDKLDDSWYFVQRNKLLKNIVTTDQRSAWFNGETDYSFNAKEAGLDYYGKDAGRDYLFFENNLTKGDKYEGLERYLGTYAYNGTVTENANGSYKLVAKKLSIDDMLSEFVAYINYALGSDKAAYNYGDALGGAATAEDYYSVTDYKKSGDNEELDYSKLVYATGKVDLADSLADEKMFVKDGARYKAMAAVNELQYAYTTDTGVLSQYIGYSVSAYETSFIKEFEYAAQQALRMGVGAFKVCAGDYGWHLIYVTDSFSFNGGETYSPEFTEANITLEGTFENRFFNWLKDSNLSNETGIKRAEILRSFNNEDTVTKYEDAYKDLTEIGK